jgi:N-acyl-D-aspartate/D-glutamate deacylase
MYDLLIAIGGNRGFGIVPARPSAREGVKQIFSRVEEIDLAVLDRIPWDFESFSESPAALLGLVDRGLLLPGLAADIVLFDPEEVGPGVKELREDRIPGYQRWTTRPRGIQATIVNGVPIVLAGEIVDESSRPGHVLRPGKAL